MFGQIEFTTFEGLNKMSQKVASAASAIETLDIVGAEYRPILYIGKRIVRGVNYVFLCEQTLITNPPAKHLVLIEVNEFGGNFEVVGSSIVEVI